MRAAICPAVSLEGTRILTAPEHLRRKMGVMSHRYQGSPALSGADDQGSNNLVERSSLLGRINMFSLAFAEWRLRLRHRRHRERSSFRQSVDQCRRSHRGSPAMSSQASYAKFCRRAPNFFTRRRASAVRTQTPETHMNIRGRLLQPAPNPPAWRSYSPKRYFKLNPNILGMFVVAPSNPKYG